MKKTFLFIIICLVFVFTSCKIEELKEPISSEVAGLHYTIPAGYVETEKTETSATYKTKRFELEVFYFDYDENQKYSMSKDKREFNGIKGFWQEEVKGNEVLSEEKYLFTFVIDDKEYYIRGTNREDFESLLNSLEYKK